MRYDVSQLSDFNGKDLTWTCVEKGTEYGGELMECKMQGPKTLGCN